MSNSSTAIFLPLLVQVMLTLGVFVGLAISKVRATRQGLVDLERRALHHDAWPESVQKINNNIRNQFEVPVLFYVLVIVCYEVGATGPVPQSLAWLFVISRIVHVYVHTGSNHVPARRSVFMFGWAIILAMLFAAIEAVI